MRKAIIAKDNVGNRLYRDTDGKLMLLNKKDQMVNAKDTRAWLRNAGYKVKGKKMFVTNSPKPCGWHIAKEVGSKTK